MAGSLSIDTDNKLGLKIPVHFLVHLNVPVTLCDATSCNRHTNLEVECYVAGADVYMCTDYSNIHI